MAEAIQMVSFVGVKESYPLGNAVQCRYTFNGAFEGSSRDWIGLYRVGWRSHENYETYVWAKLPAKNADAEVTITADNLPKDSKEFYQFCYVSADKQVCGVSTPFQLTSCFDDLVEFQDPDDPGTMVIKTRTQLLEEQCLELQKEVQGLQFELEAERTSKGKLIDQLQMVPELQKQFEAERQEKEHLQSALKEMQDGLQAERKSNEHLHEQLRELRDKLQAERKEFEENLQLQSSVGESSVTRDLNEEQDKGTSTSSPLTSVTAPDVSETKQMSLPERIAGSVLKHLQRASDWFAEEDVDDEMVTASASGPPDKVDESLRNCPACGEVFEASVTAEQISAHLETHSGSVCPICYMQFNSDYPEENVTAHVNQCLDSRV